MRRFHRFLLVTATGVAALYGCLAPFGAQSPLAGPSGTQGPTGNQAVAVTGTVRLGDRPLDAAALADLAGAPLTTADPLTATDALVTADPLSQVLPLTVGDPLTAGDPLAAPASFRRLQAGLPVVVVEAVNLSTGARLAKAGADASGRFSLGLPAADQSRQVVLQATVVAAGEVRGFLAAPATIPGNAAGALLQDVSGGSTAVSLGMALTSGVRGEFRVESGFRGFLSHQLLRLASVQDPGSVAAAVSRLDASEALARPATLDSALSAAVDGGSAMARAVASRMDEGSSRLRDLYGTHDALLAAIGKEASLSGNLGEAISGVGSRLTATDLEAGRGRVVDRAGRLAERGFLDHPVRRGPLRGTPAPTGTPLPAATDAPPAPTPTASATATAAPTATPSATPEAVWSHGASNSVLAAAFSRDGTQVVSGSSSGSVIVRALGTGETRSLDVSAKVNAVAFSKDGSKIVVATGDEDNLADRGKAYLIDLATGGKTEVARHLGAITRIAVSPDGTRLLTGSPDTKVALWSLEVPAATPERTWGYSGRVTAVAFLPDGASFVTATDNGLITWEHTTATGTPSVNTGGTIGAMAASPDGKRLAIAQVAVAAVGIRNLANLNTPQFIYSIGTLPYVAVAWHQDAVRVAVASSFRIAIWRADGPAQGKDIEEWLHSVAVGSLALSPDGSRLVTGSVDGKVRLWTVKP